MCKAKGVGRGDDVVDDGLLVCRCECLAPIQSMFESEFANISR